MNRTPLLVLCPIVLGLLTACAAGRPVDPTAQVVDDVARCCRAFLDGLPDELRGKAARSVDDDEAARWHFVPGRYEGVEMGALDEVQRVRAYDVVRAMLSASGFARARAIVALEDVLHEVESRPDRPAEHRDPDRYALLICGEPASDGTFVVRFQGHHVSLRMAVVNGVLASHTPHFLGTNPHRVLDVMTWQDADEWWTVLGDEEALGRRLLTMLDDDRRARAVVAEKAPADVLLGPAVDVAGGAPASLSLDAGLGWSDMTAAQQDVLWQLVELYAHRLRGAHAEAELQRIRDAGLERLTFAWAGGAERGDGHYYRVVGSFFAIEYDCTQNDANHVHTVWRDFERDFGGDPLREHLERAHGR